MIKVTDQQVREAQEGELLIVERSANIPARPNRLLPGVYYRYKGLTKSIFSFIQQSGGAVWGSITGSLNDQTDLQNALNAKANSADLGAVAFSNDYNDLDNLPSIPAAQIQSDWNQADNLALDFIKNKPTIPAVPTNVSAFTNDAGYQTLANVKSALSPVAYFRGTASHTGNTDETIVQVITINPAQWLTNYKYLLTWALTRAMGITVTAKVYLSTTTTHTSGTVFLLGQSQLAQNKPQVQRQVWKTGNTIEAANAAIGLTDIANVAVLSSGTFDFSQTLYMVMTIQLSAGTGTGAFVNLQLGM